MDITKKRELFGWSMYDFANSGYATTIIASVLPIYFVSIVPEGGVSFNFLGNSILLKASALWAYTMSFSLLLVALSSPILGAIADFSGSKKKLLAIYCYTGAFFTALLYFVEQGDYLLAMFLFMVANIGFAGGNVFYNAFLPQIADENEVAWISGKGFAYGYIGGGILLALNLLMITNYEWFGLESKAMGSRISFISVGVWWAVMSIPTFLFVREREGSKIQKNVSYLAIGFKTIRKTIKEIKNYRQLTLFLVAFLIYNDGVQTVVVMASIFGKEELGLSSGSLIGALLMTQFIAFPGSLLFAKLADYVGPKKSIIVSLLIWSAVVIYAYFIQTALEFWILAGVVGLILGGTQAISRSLFASFVPKKNSAEFFGFFAISNKFASIIGPLTFALIGQITGSARASILSLIVFIILGLIILTRVDVKEGIRQSKLAV